MIDRCRTSKLVNPQCALAVTLTLLVYGVACSTVALAADSVASTDAAASDLVRGDVSQSIAGFTAALNETSLTNDRRAAILNDRGVAYMRAGQMKLAIEDFNKAVQLFPEYAAVYNNRGNLLISLGLIKEAIKDLDRAILLAPGFASAYNNRAGALMRLGQTGDAIADYSKAIALMPQSAVPMSGRGQAQLALNRPHAAIRDFTRAVAVDARFAPGYRNRAEAKLMTEAYDEAIEDLSRAIAFDVSHAESYVLRGNAYLQIRNLDAAIKDFTEALTLDANQASAYQARGLAYGMTEMWAEAYADLNKAIELDPRSALAFASRAYVYKQNGQAGVGQKDVETAWKLAPDRAEVLWAKAEIDEAQGKPDQAITGLRKALALRPGYRDALDALQRLGVPPMPDVSDVVAAGSVEPWKIVRRGTQYAAVSDLYPRLNIPLEMMGEGEPRILEWEEKQDQFRGLGVLRFSGGALKTRNGAEETEQVALVDLRQMRVIGITPHRQGAKQSNWTWDNGKVSVAALDGVTEEFDFTGAGLAGAGYGAPLGAAGTRRVSGSGSSYGPAWAPWDQPLAGGASASNRAFAPKPQRAAQQKKKPKTLFDLLFN